MDKPKNTILENGNMGSDGSKIDLSGLEIPNSVPIYKDFNQGKYIGKATDINVENGSLVANLHLIEDANGLYPAISFCAIVTEKLEEGQWIKQARLVSVGLSHSPNVDPSIPAYYREQIAKLTDKQDSK